MVDGFAKTPRYVLKEASKPICPAVSQTPPGNEANVIYGFSDKPEYDVFLSASPLALVPYPMVKGFLKNQIELDARSLKLIAIDPISASQPILFAATVESVLESFLLGNDSVAKTHRLVFDESSSAYSIEAFSFITTPKPSL